ncbi:MAG: 4Fe-4S binding protein [Acidobacteria bacterium]|nr:MAG: 4Fe-4S binding protein [Acidobacteriota bacterium]
MSDQGIAGSADTRLPRLPALAPAAAAAGAALDRRLPRRGVFRVFVARRVVQGFFALVCVLLGVQFGRFVEAISRPDGPVPARPPGVEAFLPISGLMGLLDWIYQGAINVIHPAATILLLIFLAMAVLLRKAFCSWVCPIGLISDELARVGRFVFGRTFRPWWPVDVLLRGLKYLLLAFFVWAIVRMSPEQLSAWIYGGYNRVTDIKMYLFFAHLSWTAATVLAALAVLSIVIRGFWCRYLCPYGALLGLFSWISPTRIHRHEDACTQCGYCDRVCPSRLPVSRKATIRSVECTGCLDCVASCPHPGALDVRFGGRPLRPVVFAALLMGLFVAGWSGARVFDLWHNDIPAAEYRLHMQRIDSYSHPR